MNAIVLLQSSGDPGVDAAARAAVTTWSSHAGFTIRTPWMESAPGASHAARRRRIDAVPRRG